jgi:hypothetical protein
MPKSTQGGLLVGALVALSLGARVPGPVRSIGSATITGRVRMTGPLPPRTTIDMSSEPACKARYSSAPADDVVLVNPNGTLANVLVYVKAGLPPDAKFAVPTTPVTLAQDGCMYEPRVFGIMVGQPFEIENDDTLLHNVQTLGTANRRFNISQPGVSVTRSVVLRPLPALSDVVLTFTTPEVPVPFACSIHPWMHAYAGVFSHPFFAVTGVDGTFTLAGLPPGTYTIGTWQEAYGTRELKVTVGPGETKAVEVTYGS